MKKYKRFTIPIIKNICNRRSSDVSQCPYLSMNHPQTNVTLQISWASNKLSYKSEPTPPLSPSNYMCIVHVAWLVRENMSHDKNFFKAYHF